jgi:hypothetical protein
VVLLVAEDLAEIFAEGELVEFFGLADAAAVVADGLLLVFEVEAEHVGGLVAGLDGLVGDGRHSSEEIDPVAELEGVIEFLLGVDFELAGDVHVGRSLEDLRIIDVGDDGLEFALEILVEKIDELFAGDGVIVLLFCLWFCHGGAELAFGSEWFDLGEMRVGGEQWLVGCNGLRTPAGVPPLPPLRLFSALKYSKRAG